MSDQQVNDILRVLFSALPKIHQYILYAVTVVEFVVKNCNVRIIIVITMLMITVILCFILYDVCAYALQDDIILVH
jgi:hypothetical protein